MTGAHLSRLRGSDPHVLITGGCGFIGCNLADALAGKGERVLILDALTRKGTEENAAWLKSRHGDRLEIVTEDVRNLSAVRSAVTGAKAVFHLAAQVAVTSSLEDPQEDFSINAGGTLNILETVRRYNPRAAVLFASTNKVYGKLMQDGEFARRDARYVPISEQFANGVDEAAPLDFYSPYGCSKGAADQYVRDYARVFGLRTVVLRMSCIYGPRQFGTEDQGWIAHFLRQALRDAPITIYGDGYQVRDALFIDDAIAAWLLAFERIDAVQGRVFNLGGGPDNAVSLREMMELIGALRKHKPDVRFDKWRPGDQPWYVSDIGAISTALAWRPKVSLPTGLRSLHHWLVERFTERPSLPTLQEASA
jgi:CDP-paratose 2-epimerase